VGYLEKRRKERNVNVKEERKEWSLESQSTEVTEKVIDAMTPKSTCEFARTFCPSLQQYDLETPSTSQDRMVCEN
jgi:hypothetical protein